MSAYDYINAYGQRELWELDEWKTEDIEFLKSETFYEYMEHDIYLSDGAALDVVNAIKSEFNYSYYTYYLHYLDNEDTPTVIYYMTNPARMFEVLERINEEGRWTYNESLINGVMLWIVWIIELLILIIIPIGITITAVKSLNPKNDFPQASGININAFEGTAATEQYDENGRPIAQDNIYSETNYNPSLEIEETPQKDEDEVKL